MSGETLTTQAELALVAAVLTRGDAEFAWVRSEVALDDWGDVRARAVMDASARVVDGGGALSRVAIASHLEQLGAMELIGGLPGLDGIAARDRPGERDALLKRVVDHARVRAAQRNAAAIAREGLSPDAVQNPDEYLASVAGIADQARSTLRTDTKTAREVAAETFRDFQDRGKIKPAIPTPINELNEMLAGGWWPGRPYIIGARPGVGKSALMIAAATHGARHGHPQLIFSREMTQVELCGRAVVEMADVDAQKWQYGPSAFTAPEGRAIVSALSRYAELPIEINTDDDEAGAMMAKAHVWLDTVVRPLQAERDGIYPMIWIDYLQECRKHGKHDSYELMLGEVMSMFKTFGLRQKVAMGVVAALNRKNKNENRRPRKSDLRYCGTAEFHAYTVILLDREDGAIEEDDDAIGRLVEQDAEIIIDKNRGGRTGIINATWRGDRYRWTARPAWNNHAGQYAEH